MNKNIKNLLYKIFLQFSRLFYKKFKLSPTKELNITSELFSSIEHKQKLRQRLMLLFHTISHFKLNAFKMKADFVSWLYSKIYILLKLVWQLIASLNIIWTLQSSLTLQNESPSLLSKLRILLNNLIFHICI